MNEVQMQHILTTMFSDRVRRLAMKIARLLDDEKATREEVFLVVLQMASATLRTDPPGA